MRPYEIVEHCREVCGMTRTQLAEKLFMHKQSYGKLARGEVRIREDHVHKLCRVFSITPNHLFGYEALPGKYATEDECDHLSKSFGGHECLRCGKKFGKTVSEMDAA